MDVDTIVALSTPPGVGAVAMVRVSGPRAADILRTMVSPDVQLPPPRVAALMGLIDPVDGSALERAVVTRFEAPASFTGEDMVEISCHGGWLVPALVEDACRRAGARPAEPGEFTRRAYLRGKVDLVQAEAIADLIGARSRAAQRVALSQLERGLSSRVVALRDRLVGVEALLAHHVDFPEEDDAPVDLDVVVSEADTLVREMRAMLATAPEGELLREGALTVLAGRPNVGKSSLYNALVGTERALVTEEAGTTRDALESVVQLGGYPFRLVDTAGLREDAGRVERMGIEVAQRYLRAADIVLLCIPAGEKPAAEELRFVEELGEVPIVIVETKADLEDGSRGAGHAWGEDAVEEGGAHRVRVSVREGTGLEGLKALLPEIAFAGIRQGHVEVPVLTRRRHAEALGVAVHEVESFADALRSGVPAEMAATHLRAAETALEEMIGVVTVEDVLDVVFRQFCIGK